jgi:hypothetical protein
VVQPANFRPINSDNAAILTAITAAIPANNTLPLTCTAFVSPPIVLSSIDSNSSNCYQVYNLGSGYTDNDSSSIEDSAHTNITNKEVS